MQGPWAVIRDLTSLPQGTVKTRLSLLADTVSLAAEDQLARRGRKVQREGAQVTALREVRNSRCKKGLRGSFKQPSAPCCFCSSVHPTGSSSNSLRGLSSARQRKWLSKIRMTMRLHHLQARFFAVQSQLLLQTLCYNQQQHIEMQ